MKKITAIILAFTMLFSLCACSKTGSDALNFDNITSDSIHGTRTEIESGVIYHIKINPEFEVEVDDDLNVIAVKALNDDGESVLNNIDIIGLSVSDAFMLITEEAENQGFLTTENGNTVEISIDGISSDMEICHVCGGCGTVVCDECNGTGILCDECVLCNSTGIIYEDSSEAQEWHICPQCDGAGYLYEPDEGCWACHGSGICPDCGGTGRETVTNEYGEVVYGADGSPETDACIFCSGTGVCSNCIGKPCNMCNVDETGENPGYVYETVHYEESITCPDCGGLGYLKCNDSFNGYNWCPCCWGSGIDGTGDPNYTD